MIFDFDESSFLFKGSSRHIITASSSLDAVTMAEENIDVDIGFHFRVFADREKWLLDVEGCLDVLRHSKIMKILYDLWIVPF